MSRPPVPPMESFLKRAVRGTTTECWLWPGTTSKGYGIVASKRLHSLVHRLAYEAWVGPIPEGKELHHACENKRCFNPAHLMPVAHKDHTRLHPANPLTANARKTHCLRGHELSGYNLMVTKTGGRACRECNSLRNRELYARKAAAAGRGIGPSKGELRYNAILSPDLVREIRKQFAAGEKPSVIARNLGLERSTVTNITYGGGWKHVT